MAFTPSPPTSQTPPSSTTPPGTSSRHSSPIFASRSPSPSQLSRAPEPSDVPAVRRQHVTDGYRAGISAGKAQAQTAQAGFDEGYPIGATLGLRIGRVLGALEQVVRTAARSGDVEGLKVAEERLNVARQELTVDALLHEMSIRGMLGKSAEQIEDEKERGIEAAPEMKFQFAEGWELELEPLRKWEAASGR